MVKRLTVLCFAVGFASTAIALALLGLRELIVDVPTPLLDLLLKLFRGG